jgi:hypothetical protein
MPAKCGSGDSAGGGDALVAGVGPALPAERFRGDGADDGPNIRMRKARAGDHRFAIITVQRGAPPPISVDGDTVRVGNQTIRFDGQKLILGR